jgi:hypothetical protein
LKSYKSKESSPYLKIKEKFSNNKEDDLTKKISIENQYNSKEYIQQINQNNINQK